MNDKNIKIDELKDMLNMQQDSETKEDNQNWLNPLLLLIGMSLGGSKNTEPDKNLILEKEVAYLHGKIDTLEKLITG